MTHESETSAKTTHPQHPAHFERVVVATDFSAGAELAIARAARLPLAEGATLSIVHVLTDRLFPTMHTQVEQAARRHLEEAAATLSEGVGRPDIKVSTEVRRGRGYAEILQHAQSIGAELVVLGRHGHRAVKDMFIGSTAERVIRTGDLPVLVVHRKAKRKYRHPLVAVDLEGGCRTIIAAALRAVGTEVKTATLIHVYQVPFEGFVMPTSLPDEMSRLRKEYKRTAATQLETLQSSLHDFGVQWETAVVRGDPRAKILDEVNKRRADLLAVGTHGRSGLSHAVIGSVAEGVIRAADCDVLVAKPGA